MKVSDFDFDLPGELVATHPLERRDASRMLVVGMEAENSCRSHSPPAGESEQSEGGGYKEVPNCFIPPTGPQTRAPTPPQGGSGNFFFKIGVVKGHILVS